MDNIPKEFNTVHKYKYPIAFIVLLPHKKRTVFQQFLFRVQKQNRPASYPDVYFFLRHHRHPHGLVFIFYHRFYGEKRPVCHLAGNPDRHNDGDAAPVCLPFQ